MLSVLARTTRPLTGHEVARLAGRSEPGVRRALKRLVSEGLVDALEAGRARLHTLNRDHVVAPAVEALANARIELVARLRAAVETWERAPAQVSLFGSFARGEGNTASDIDVLVVRAERVDEDDRRWRDQLEQLRSEIQRWTGNRAGLAEISYDEFHTFRSTRPPVHEELTRDAIHIYGN